jgi:mRNA-degrading endonuclease YafQ of YafQ-DinJ toxin-antitoxin module
MEEYDSSQLFKKAMERLNERQKELSCLYHILEVLKDDQTPLESTFYDIIEKLPAGWQYPSVCEASITYEGQIFRTPLYKDTEWKQSAELIVDDGYVGKIEVVYTQFIRETKGSQFLPEEQKLLNHIAEMISAQIFSRRLRSSMHALERKAEKLNGLQEPILSPTSDEHWKWRMHMAELIAARLDPEYYGVKGMYIIGSTKNNTSGPSSDLDLIIHIDSDHHRHCELTSWLKGWSMCLAEINFHRTGHKTDELLDIHYVTDQEIQDKNSYAIMINAVTDKAKPLPLKRKIS